MKLRVAIIFFIGFVLLLGMSGVGVGHYHSDMIDDDTDTVTITIDETGNAEVSLHYAFDLSNGTQLVEFRQIEVGDEEEQLRSEFDENITSVSESMSENRSDDVSVGTVQTSVTRDVENDTGSMYLNVSWYGLGEQDDGIVVTEPFDDGFLVDDGVYLKIDGPNNGWYVDSTPRPDEERDDVMVWKNGTVDDSEMFEIVFVEHVETESDQSFPIFPLIVVGSITTGVILLGAREVYLSD